MGRPLLETRLCDLGLRLEDSRFYPVVKRVQGELGSVGIRLVPRFYLSTEYGCITASATIGLLFTDGFAHTQRLARKHGVRTRGLVHVLPTVRHEVGHAFCYAHKLYKEPRFRQLFGARGHFFRTYPEGWKPAAGDHLRLERGEVIYLYATRHADEDFAICFQTWLAAAAYGRDWRRAWAKRPVIAEKLAYVEDAVRRHGSRRVSVLKPPLDEPLHEITLTVEAWIARVLNGTNYNLLPTSPVAQ